MVRLRINYTFIMRFSVVYLISLLFINLVQPVLFITLTEADSLRSLDNYTWAKSFSLVTMMFYVIEVNAMQLLILFFHHRLDQH